MKNKILTISLTFIVLLISLLSFGISIQADTTCSYNNVSEYTLSEITELTFKIFTATADTHTGSLIFDTGSIVTDELPIMLYVFIIVALTLPQLKQWDSCFNDHYIVPGL